MLPKKVVTHHQHLKKQNKKYLKKTSSKKHSYIPCKPKEETKSEMK